MKEYNKYTEATQAVVASFVQQLQQLSNKDVESILALISDDIEWNIPGDVTLAPWLGKRTA